MSRGIPSGPVATIVAMSAANGHGGSSHNGPDLSNGPHGGPYSMTIAGVPLNPVPEVWNGMAATGAVGQ